MTKVSEMIPDDTAARRLAAGIERMLDEDIPAVDKELNIQSFDRTVDREELLGAWPHLSSLYRAAYKYWVSRAAK